MNITLSRAQAKAVAAVLHDHLEDWCSIPGVDRDDVAEALHLIEVATNTASVKLKPSPMVEAAPDMLEALRDARLDLIDHTSNPAISAVVDRIAAAIAKATA